ncbi:MAG: hypothetical protein KatS3mg104_1776 [Phycisphaerae bacterium]|jgi:hypothetical protein|nr:MAG: hypothetical protein KatS3mg104_1776 [Phycisphaerae bacterium]
MLVLSTAARYMLLLDLVRINTKPSLITMMCSEGLRMIGYFQKIADQHTLHLGTPGSGDRR